MLYEFKFERGTCIFKLFTRHHDNKEIVTCIVIDLHNIDHDAFSNLIIHENIHSVCETWNARLHLTLSNLQYGEGIEYVVRRSTISRIMRTNNLEHLVPNFEPIFKRMPLQQGGLFLGHSREKLRERTTCIWRKAVFAAIAWNRWRRHTVANVYHPTRMKRCFSAWIQDDIEQRQEKRRYVTI